MEDNKELAQVLSSFLIVMDKQQTTLNRIERILMGAQSPQMPAPLVGSDFVFERFIKDLDEVKKDIEELKKMFVSPEEE